jgi:Cu(I)/Ag(I) efflux system membrane protein CusA/SilA
VQSALPAGVRIVATYDRSGLIRDSIHTLRRTLIEEAVVVSLVALAFLFHFRSALIPIITLPIAVLASFVPMYYLGVSSNIMSLGGLALAIGELVDASIVMVENAYRHITETPDGRPATVPIEDQAAAVIRSARQVGRPSSSRWRSSSCLFCRCSCSRRRRAGCSGRWPSPRRSPMASATLLSVTVVPVLMTFILRGRKLRPEAANPFSRVSVAIYRFCLGAALRFRWTTLLVNFAVVPAVVPLLFLIGTEFMPPLYEGSLLYMPTSPPGMSVTEATRMLQIQDRVLRRFPEVERVFGTVGRGTTATDNSPMGMVNTTVTLKPRERWRKGMTIEKLQAEMDDALQVPGFPNTWTQPIRNRLDMLFHRRQDARGHQGARPRPGGDPADRPGDRVGPGERGWYQKRLRRTRHAGVLHGHRRGSCRHRPAWRERGGRPGRHRNSPGRRLL